MGGWVAGPRAKPHAAWLAIRLNFDLLYMIAIMGGFYIFATLLGATFEELWTQQWLLPQASAIAHLLVQRVAGLRQYLRVPLPT